MEYLRRKERATQSFLNRFVTPSVTNANCDGYALLLEPAQFSMDQALEWTKLERECCPFLEVEVRWDIENGPVWLDLKGPQGVKDFILNDFGLR
jgi:hypothetical protein